MKSAAEPDTVPAMSSKVRIGLVICVAASLTGCGQNALDSPTADSSAVTAPSASASRPSVIRSLRPVAKVTSACALLSAAELKALLGGGSSRTKVTATEVKSTKISYSCEYGSGGKKPFVLIVSSSDVPNFMPKDMIDAAAKLPHVKIQRVKGIGSAAVFHVTKNGGLIAASKRSHEQTRSVIFSAPKIVPERKFAEVARLVISRI
jgi:hypothetical protein